MFRGWLTFLLLVSSVAHADPAAPAKQHAAELATESTQHYKRGEFEVSVALLREAYALYPEPNLLYNLGRSLEGMGDTKGAIEAYESYLATGKDIEDRGAIERRVATLKSLLTEKQQHDAPPPVVVPPPVVAQPPPVAVVQPVQPPPRDEAAPSKLPWVAIIGGVAVLGGGVAFGSLASSRHNEANEPSTSGLDASVLQNDATRYATIANAMFAVGGVALAGGIIWEIHEHHAHSSSITALRARVGPGSFALEWTFP